jgi:hypothetical protein
MSDERLQPQPVSQATAYAPIPGDEPRPKPAGALASVIPYNNPLALVGYYCSVFSLIPGLGLLTGPAAIILGFLGLRFVGKNPTAKGTAHAVVALILGAFGTLGNIVALIAVVAAIVMMPR